MSTPADPTGSLEVALAHAARLLDTQPELAAEQALEILKVVPKYPPAVLVLGSAHRRLRDTASALGALDPLVDAQPTWAVAHYERALALADAGRGDEAIAALRRTVELKPDHPEGWRILADQLLAAGDVDGADKNYIRHVQVSTRNPELLQAAAAMLRNDIPQAEALLKSHLAEAPTDVPAIRMLAEVAVRCGRNHEAEQLLERCLELAPNFAPARYNYAVVLYRLNKTKAALQEVERLLARDPRNPGYRNLQAVLFTRIGEYPRSLQIYSELLAESPGHAKIWLSYGHVLKTEGRLQQGIEAYRRSIACEPGFGEAYWSLANLKTFRFTSEDLSAMHQQLDRGKLDDLSRLSFHFALGKASEDAGEYAAAFEHYEKGNALYRAGHPYDPTLNVARMARLKKVFTREFFRERTGSGCDAPDPIFVVSMPRAGSTLLEQILSSHSQVEGTSELPELLSMAKDLRQEANSDEAVAYAEVLVTKTSAELRQLGEEYLERTRIQRKTGRPFFIDKMPNNFLHVGMIQLILPNAKIIDARRHPLACCFSNFKQLYARGQLFSYGLSDMGSYYRDYVDLMAHFDEVLPGRVHSVHYERMVADTEGEVRRLLAYCGLPFEPGCLRFFENERAVRTASSEQVRQPIYQGGVDQWRHFEQWLGPLKSALGPALDGYPADSPPP